MTAADAIANSARLPVHEAIYQTPELMVVYHTIRRAMDQPNRPFRAAVEAAARLRWDNAP